MPQPKKNYTLNDIGRRLDGMDNRLIAVEDWKNGIQIGKAAVEEYKKQEADTKLAKDKSEIYDKIKDLMPYISILIGGVMLIIYAYASRSK